MSKISIEFGYFPSPLDINAGPVKVETLDDIEIAVSDMNVSEGIEKDWIYAPLHCRRNFGHEGVEVLPYSSRVFGLPKTHIITHASADNAEHLDFLIWGLSFFIGMRLTSTEAGFVDATPTKPNKLNDFILIQSDLADAVTLIEAFWQRYKADPRMAKRMMGCIHALFLAQYPQNLSYERFIYLYTALDACFAMIRSQHPKAPAPPNHATRVEWMCAQFAMNVPSWASANNKASEVSLVRNETIHEALFFGEPLGFAIYGSNQTSRATNVELEMEALLCRLIVGILGRPGTDYVKSPVTTRQRHGLTL